MPLDIITWSKLKKKADLVEGKIPASQLPSYVDDVIEVDTFDDLPDPGEKGKIYITLDTNKTYRWSGSTYVPIGTDEITDYNNLVNKPKINDIELTGNKTASDLGLASQEDLVAGLATKQDTLFSYEGEDKFIDGRTIGKGLVITNDNKIARDVDIIPNVDYVDDSISDTMLYIQQEIANEHAGRVAGDNLKQNITDNNLQTTAKTIVGAINELNNKSGGTKVIANGNVLDELSAGEGVGIDSDTKTIGIDFNLVATNGHVEELIKDNLYIDLLSETGKESLDDITNDDITQELLTKFTKTNTLKVNGNRYTLHDNNGNSFVAIHFDDDYKGHVLYGTIGSFNQDNLVFASSEDLENLDAYIAQLEAKMIGQLIVKSAGFVTLDDIDSTAVPSLSVQQVTDIYNALSNHKVVYIEDMLGANKTLVLQGAPIDGKITIYFEYFSRLGLIYTINNNTVEITYKDILGKSYLDRNYAPLSFVANLWGKLNTGNIINLVDTAPVADPNNILQLTGSTNTEYNWNNPSAVFVRKVEVDTTLVSTNSMTFTLKYKVSRSVTISWGAKIQYSTDNQNWEDLSTNQSFNAVTVTDYSAGVSTDITVFMDSIVGTKNIAKDSYLRILLFKKQGSATELTTNLYFGVTVDNAYVGTFAQFNFANVSVNTEQIADNAITKQKLAIGLQQEIDNKLDATSVTEMPIPNTAMGRDNNGRSQVESPINAKDIANKGYVDDKLLDTNVKLSAELKTYYSIGKISASTTNPKVVGNVGDSIRDVLNNIMNLNRLQPTKVNPSITNLVLSSNASDEYGTVINSINYSITNNTGSYTYGPSPTGSTWTQFLFSGDTTTLNPQQSSSGTLNINPYTVGVSEALNITVTGSYSDGNIAKDNAGDNSDPVVKILAGTSSKSAIFSKTAKYYTYWKLTNSTDVPTSGNKISSGDTAEIATTNNSYIWFFSKTAKTKIQQYALNQWNDLNTTSGQVQFILSNGVTVSYYYYRTDKMVQADPMNYRII